jgi:stringent starvation protein B
VRTATELKRSVVDAFIRTGAVTRLYLDPRRADVVVPANLKQSEWLCLDIGLNLPKPIPNLYWAGDCVRGTVSFNGTNFDCWVPYSAVLGVRNQSTGELVTWVSAATAALAQADKAPSTERLPPKASAKVVNLADWRRARGR